MISKAGCLKSLKNTFPKADEFTSSFTQELSSQLYFCGIDAFRCIGAVSQRTLGRICFRDTGLQTSLQAEKNQVLQPLISSQTILVALHWAYSTLIALVCTRELQLGHSTPAAAS